MVNRLKFNVGGHIYCISTNALNNGPQSKLTRMYKSVTNTTGSTYIEVDRPADMFASVLALYQTGQLHFPLTSCPGAFLNELEFWEILPEMAESCCLNRLQSFVDEQDTLGKFRESREAERKRFCYSNQFMTSIKGKVWNIVDYSKPSVLGRLYFMVSLCMVLMSIFTLAFSTDPYFRRKMTNCERLEYMEYSGMEKIELASKWLKPLCNSSSLPHHHPPKGTHQPSNSVENGCTKIKQNIEIIFLLYHEYNDDDYNATDFTDNDNDVLSHNKSENDQSAQSRTPGNHTAGLFETTTYSGDSLEHSTPPVDMLETATPPSDLSESLFTTSKSPKTSQKPKMTGEFVEIPAFEIEIYAFVLLEAVYIVYFTIDIILRFLSCPSRKWYFFSLINFTDVLALISSYTHFALMQIYKHEKYRDSWIDVLKYLQVLRSFRLFRIVSNVRAGQVLAYTVKVNFKDLSILILFLVVGMSSFASCMFVAEERDDFRSIPVGWYWALVTMTTVGYGDIAPKTAVGRVMACLCAFAGMILLALTVPIFANNFLTLYKFANSEKAVQKFQQKQSKIKKTDNENLFVAPKTCE